MIINGSVSSAGSTSITTVGTITTGVWNGTALTANYVPDHDDLNGFVAAEHVSLPGTVVNVLTDGDFGSKAITTTGNVTIDSDSNKLIMGDGQDVNVYYDGTDFKVVTDVVSASDFVVDCGTNKTLELTEKVWDDQQINMGDVASSGWGASDWCGIVEYKTGVAIEFENSTSSGYKIRFNAQITHKYAEGEDIEFHIHIGNNSTTSGNAVFKLTYQWATMEDTFPSASSSQATVAIDGTDSKHQMEDIVATISGTGKEVSSILLCELERVADDASDTFSESVYVIGIDFHVPLNTMGSRQEGVK